MVNVAAAILKLLDIEVYSGVKFPIVRVCTNQNT